MVVLLLLILVVVGVVVWPLLCIWACNLLFGLAIPYTVSTWAASLILSVTVGASKSSSTKS